MLLLYPVNSLVRGSFLFFIYIPLCFYFIAESTKGSQGERDHLHSIMLLLYLIADLCMTNLNVSTFHYASTLSRQVIFSKVLIIYLHSIMLLLYREWGLTDTQYVCDLHSIMLLLYPGYPLARLLFVSPSTFHYASTLSNLVWTGHICRSRIYIPLCFYFIFPAHTGWSPACPSTFHYASTLS